MKRQLMGLLVPLFALPTTVFSGSPQYDPLSLAIQNLDSMGYPPPQGYSISETKPNELGPVPGKTFPDSSEIKIDVSKLAEVMEEHGDASPDALVGAVTMILHHEYQHTADYGIPSDGGQTGYNNGPCQHLQLAIIDMDFYCDHVICETTSDTAKAAMCSHRDTYVGILNGMEAARKQCNGGNTPPPIPACPCCP